MENNDKCHRYALEWFVREQDKFYWEMTKGMVKSIMKKTAILAVISTAVSVMAAVISYSVLLRKFR